MKWILSLSLVLFCNVAFAANLPYMELHTHFRGSFQSKHLVQIAREHAGITYPTALLKELGIQTKDLPRVPVNSLSPRALTKLERAMDLSNEISDFKDLERAYRFRFPLTVFDPNQIAYFEALTRNLADSFVQQKVGYAEVSGANEMLDPQWLKLMSRILPEIERTKGVRLRYLIGLRRNIPAQQIIPLIQQIGRTENSYIVGVDFLGEELNSTAEFVEAIKEAAKLKRIIPGFDIRVHAGESALFAENIKEAIRAGATRIGHGVYGLDDETLRLAREHNVIIEINGTSNIRLGNIKNLSELPVRRYEKAGVRFFAGTDGAGIFQTTIQKEIDNIFTSTGFQLDLPRHKGHHVFVPGSFDPPTKGHLELFLTAFEKYNTDKLIIMLNTVAGPKDYYASFEQRKAMILAMLPEEYRGKAEFMREPPGRGALVALENVSRDPRNLIIALIGEDAFKNGSNIPENLRYKVIARPGQEKKIELGKNAESIAIKGIDGISSSVARVTIQKGDREALNKLLAAPVIEMIYRDKMYLTPAGDDLARRQSDYVQAFENFQLDLQAANIGLSGTIAPPEFIPSQSPQEWADKFLRAVRNEPNFNQMIQNFYQPGCAEVLDSRPRLTY